MDCTPSIDELLQHYLTLLDRYTTLQAELCRLQTATFQNLARANFAAERGLRFGPDHYDQRMQALRRAQITDDPAGSGLTFHVRKVAADAAPEAETQGEQAETAAPEQAGEKEAAPDSDGAAKAKPEPKPLTTTPRDPIRWFGLLTPLALRQTQASAVDVVERVVPQLLTVDAEMRKVEIEVRRARKRRAKAEAAVAKQDVGKESTRGEVMA